METPESVQLIHDHAPEDVPAVASASIWHNRDFLVVLVGQSVSALGDAVSFTALPLLVIVLTGSGVAMGLVGVLQTLPDLFFGLPAGALADRWDRRRMMLYADVGRAALTALIPLSVLLGLDTMSVILLVTAPINLLRVVFMAGFTSAMPALVGREQVGRANGYSEAIFSFSFIVGPAIAGVLTAVIGPGPTLAIDAASFLASGIGLALVRRPLRAVGGRGDQHLLAEIAEGVRYIVREPTLRAVVAFWGIVSVLSAPLVPAVIFFLSVDRGEPAEIVGLVISGYGAGYLVGAVISGRLAKGPLGRLMIVGTVLQSGVLMAFAVVDTPLLWLTFSSLTGLFGALVLISYITLRATIPPDHLLGRVGSTARTISLGLGPVGLLIGGVLLDTIGGGSTILLVASAVIVVSLAGVTSRSLRGAVAGTGAR